MFLTNHMFSLACTEIDVVIEQIMRFATSQAQKYPS